MTEEDAPPATEAEEDIVTAAAGPDAAAVVNVAGARWAMTAARVVLRDRIALVEPGGARLAAFYVEAIRVLREGDPEIRLAVAGHTLRELQDGLRKEYGVAKVGGGAGVFYQWVRDAWGILIQGRPPKTGNRLWPGVAIDGPLARFLGRLHDEITKMMGLRPKQREQHATTLARLDPGFAGAPDAARAKLVDVWMGFGDVFSSATHGNDPSDLEDAAKGFEVFLADRLIPRTFAKQAAIGDFVRGVESGA